MLFHELANLLLKQKNLQVVLPASNKEDLAESLTSVHVINDGCDEPFNEYILLEGETFIGH